MGDSDINKIADFDLQSVILQPPPNYNTVTKPDNQKNQQHTFKLENVSKPLSGITDQINISISQENFKPKAPSSNYIAHTGRSLSNPSINKNNNHSRNHSFSPYSTPTTRQQTPSPPSYNKVTSFMKNYQN